MAVYYNDNDSKVCAWAEELIRQGLLPDGEVDCRSILDVDEVDLWGFDQWHFFCGILGWPYALQLAGLEGVEGIMTGSPPCQPFSSAGQRKGQDDERHLAPKFAELVGAIRPRMLFGEQVASAAVFGKAAARDRNFAGGQPVWAWFDDLSDRLEAARYAVGTSDIPAAGVGAPHIRQRTFFCAFDLERLDDPAGARCIAERVWAEDQARDEARLRGLERGRSDIGMGYSTESTRERDAGSVSGAEAQVRGEGELDGRGVVGPEHASTGVGGMADSEISGWREEFPDSRGGGSGDRAEGWAAGSVTGSSDSGMADSLEPGLEGHGGDGDGGCEPGRIGAEEAGPTAEGGRDSGMADTDSGERGGVSEYDEYVFYGASERRVEGDGESAGGGAGLGVGDTSSRGGTDEREQRSRQHGLQSEDRSLDGSRDSGSQHSGPDGVGSRRTSSDHGGWDIADWLFCRDGKWRPVIPSSFEISDGLPTQLVQGRYLFSPLTKGEEARVMRLKGYGNAIIPQAAAVFIKSSLEALFFVD